MNLAAIVRDNASKLRSKPAIVYGDTTITYRELWNCIEGIAAFLADAGVGRGDRVGLAMKDHPRHVIAHYAVARIGAVILPMDHRWTEGEKHRTATTFNSAAVLTDDEPIPDVPSLRLEETALHHDATRLGEIDERDCDLLISLSSGTTGSPKGALVTHRNFFERFKAQWSAIGYSDADCFALLTPLFFGAGRSFAMTMLAVGGTLRLAPPPLKPPQIVEVLQERSVTATFLPPTLLRRLLPLSSGAPLLPNINYLIVSGEPLFADEARVCREQISPNLYSYYASSEGGGISLLTPPDFDDFADTVGRPMPDTEVQIVDTEDRQLPAGEVGRLRYRGPGVALRYVNSDGQEKSAGSDGWFYPGDLAERLESGHIALRGRDKDVIIRGGVNIYPAEIESAILQHADVEECAVVGIADAARGQVVVAFIVGSGSSADELAAYCQEHLAPYKVPQEFRLLGSLPKAASGKVDKKALAED